MPSRMGSLPAAEAMLSPISWQPWVQTGAAPGPAQQSTGCKWGVELGVKSGGARG